MKKVERFWDDKNGKLTFKNGVVYTGAFDKDRMTGYAEKQYSDGIYKGNFVDGKREGIGTFTNSKMTESFLKGSS